MTKNPFLAAAALLLVSVSASAESLRLEAGAEYSSGDYGTPRSIEVFYVPLSAEYERGRFIGKATIPYLSVSYTSQVSQNVQVGGPVQPGPVPRSASQASSVTSTSSGIGDILLSAGYRVLADPASGWYVMPKVLAKLGTADESRGLGTGEHDYSLQLDLAKVFHPWTVYGHSGYTLTGDPPGVPLDDTIYGRLGAERALDGGISAGMHLEARQASSPALSARSEATAYISGPIDEKVGYTLYLKAGFSNSAPDWTAGGSVTYQMW